jgi:hypothetical protein
MSDYDFIIDGKTFSYSSVSTFNTCPYSFKLTYLDSKPRENNFYGQYGTLVHECFEKFFSGEIEAFDLSQYYRENYKRLVTLYAPTPPYGLDERYQNQGQEFFDSFSFNKDDYKVLLVEDTINFDLNYLMVVAKPDVVLRHRETGKTILLDYKTATPYRNDKKTGKEIVDTKKINGYHKQMFLYTYALRTERKMPIDEIILWYTRLNRMVTIPWTLQQEDESVKWFDDSITKIKAEEHFKPNTSSPYFCNNLCSVRTYCEYKPENMDKYKTFTTES